MEKVAVHIVKAGVQSRKQLGSYTPETFNTLLEGIPEISVLNRCFLREQMRMFVGPSVPSAVYYMTGAFVYHRMVRRITSPREALA